MVLLHDVGSTSHQTITNHHIKHYFFVRNEFSLINISDSNFYQLISICSIEKLGNHQKLTALMHNMFKYHKMAN